jgi:aminodeoxychorismate synthase component I
VLLQLTDLRAAVASVEIRPAPEPPAAFEALRAGAEPWLLESTLRSERLGRRSFAGADPWLVLRAWGERLEIECRRAVRPDVPIGRRILRGDPLATVRALLQPAPEGAPHEIPFAGGAVGYLGYELARLFEPTSLAPRDERGLPDLLLLFVDRVLAWDHREGRLVALGLGVAQDADGARERARTAAREIAAGVAAGAAPPREGRPAARKPARAAGDDRVRFERGVAEILGEIAAGNVYQACLTHRLELEFRGDPFELYRELRRTSPAPFACYLELPERVVIGSSPERFLRVEPDGRVESRPIKGTRPRGSDATSDACLREELAASEKDRAENVMIADLVRNDLGRVCATGSVAVPELCAIEAYAPVFQMVSTIQGRLAPGRDALDLVRASFPPGSMTGAPKIAAMRLLDRLEPAPRGIYSGAIGWLDARGGADLSVVIRTLLVGGGRAFVHAGAGIVADSDPRAEWLESLDKARAPLAALAACGSADAAALLAPSGMLGAPHGRSDGEEATWDRFRESGSSRSRASDPAPSAG